MEPPRENSPSTPSRFLNNYLQQPELYSQGFQQRLPTQHSFYPDNLTTANNKYLKRPHPQTYEKNDSEREKKYDKKLDDNGENKYLQQQHSSYDSYNSDSYSATNLPASASSTATGSTSQAKSSSTTATPATGTSTTSGTKNLANGKKTKGRVKIKMEYIDNKLRRYTTFSKRKTGIMKKAYELSTLTGTQVMLLVASETGHVYTFATRKLQPMITSEAGKTLIQTCLNSPDIPVASSDQRMSATGFEETELNYSISDLGGDPDKANDKDDITTSEEEQSCDESSNDENFVASSHEINSKPATQNVNQKLQPSPRLFNDDKLLLQQQIQQQKMNEKMIDNQNKILLENLSNLPQNILQNLIQTGQLQLCTDDDGVSQYITIPIAIQTDNTQEIITKKIPIKLLSQKIKSENE